MRHVDLIGLHVDAESGAPLMLLQEQEEPHRVLPIVIGGPEALAIAQALGEPPPPRPLTHDLLITLVESLDAHVDRVEVTSVHDGAFQAELTVSGPAGAHRLDSRPSDAIALAIRVDAPLFVCEAVMDEAGAILTEAMEDDDEIDEEVGRFRSFLADLDPAAFLTGPAGEAPPSAAEPEEPGPEEPGRPPEPGPDQGPS